MRTIQNGFDKLFTTAAELIDDLLGASRRGQLVDALVLYTQPDLLVIDEVGYLTYGSDAAKVLFHVVNHRHKRQQSMIFTTNKPLNTWGRVLQTTTSPRPSSTASSNGDACSRLTAHPCAPNTLALTTRHSSRHQPLNRPDFPEPTRG